MRAGTNSQESSCPRADRQRSPSFTAAGTGLLLLGRPLVEVNALFFTPEELERRAHPYELARSDTITLRVNHRQMGLGGDNSWGALPHPEYRLPASRSLHLRLSLGATLLGAAAADGAEAAATVALRAAATAAAVATTGPAAVTGLSPVV